MSNEEILNYCSDHEDSPDSGEDPETIINWMCKIGVNMKKDLDYDNNNNITEIDENHVNISNTYSASTILNAKNPIVDEETKGCITSTYTQDLKLQHEDRFLMAMSTLSNLRVIRYNNPSHKYTSNIIVPPNKTLHEGMVRLIENTLSQMSNAFVINVFGGSYLTLESEFDTVGDKYMPYDKNIDRGNPADLAFILSSIKSLEHQILIFNHFGREDQYQHFLTNPFKRISLFDQSGNISFVHKILEQYERINDVDDHSQYIYDFRILSRSIQLLYREGFELIIFNVNYNYNNVKNQLSYENNHKYYDKKGIQVEYKKNQIIITIKDNKYKKV
jgi:hypothetical protein